MRRIVSALALMVATLAACGDNVAPDLCLAMQCHLPDPPTCTDGATLVVSAFASCDESSATPCQYSTSTVNCAETGQVCSAGACHAPGDPCIGETCDTPPAPSCQGDTLTVYDATGTCDGSSGDAVCSYTSQTTDCTANGQVCAGGACVDRCGGVTCNQPPAASCGANGDLTTYSSTGTCDTGTGQCDYTPSVSHCTAMNTQCDAGAGACVDPCATNPCTTPPADFCDDPTHAHEHKDPGTCTSPSGVVACDYDKPVDCGAIDEVCDATSGDCADPCVGFACTTPPASFCDADGITLEQYGATGTCSSPGGTPGCDYGTPAPTDCSATGGACSNGACIDVCTPNPCTSPPADVCIDATHADIHLATGVCTVVSSAPSCDYDHTVDCGATDQACAAGECVFPCDTFSCTTPPPATCGGAGNNVAQAFAATGTCTSPGGAPTCSYTEADTDCSLSGQTCDTGACTGPVLFVRLQFPATITDVAGTSQTVYGRIYIQGVTDVSGVDDPVGANVKVQLGIGTGSDPTAWTWTDAIQNATYGPGSPGYEANNDEYQATFAIAGTAGTTMGYAYRLSNDGGTTWLYGDTGAAGSSDGFTTPGVLDIAAPYVSEYIEGSSNNKALEIYNPGSTSFSLSGCQIQVFANGSTTGSSPIALTGTASIASLGTYVVCNTGYTTAVSGGQCQQTSGNFNWNGNDAIVFSCGGTVLDSFGQVGNDPGANGWGTGNLATTDHTLLRDCDVISGDTVDNDTFDPSVQWAGYAKDTDDLGARNCPLP